jgi:hypothetical protein
MWRERNTTERMITRVQNEIGSIQKRKTLKGEIKSSSSPSSEKKLFFSLEHGFSNGTTSNKGSMFSLGSSQNPSKKHD